MEANLEPATVISNSVTSYVTPSDARGIRVLIVGHSSAGMKEIVNEYIDSYQSKQKISIVIKDNFADLSIPLSPNLLEVIFCENASRNFLRTNMFVDVILFCVDRSKMSIFKNLWMPLFTVIAEHFQRVQNSVPPKNYLVAKESAQKEGEDYIPNETLFSIASFLKSTSIYNIPLSSGNIPMLFSDCIRPSPFFGLSSNEIIDLDLNHIDIGLKKAVLKANYLKKYELELPDVPLIKPPSWFKDDLPMVEHLIRINFSRNYITDSSTLDVVFSIKSLESLDLSHNLLNTIPDSIGNAKKLKYINFEGNYIEKVPSSIQYCASLQIINLQFNKLKIAPIELGQLTNLDKKNGIQLTGNKLINLPSKFLNRDTETLVSYFRDLQKSEKIEKWRRMKVLIIGEEGVGKTHFVTALQEKKYVVNQSTDGIEISDYVPTEKEEDVKFRFFDFGGQEVFYPTHMFFLTKSDALYILMFSLEKPNFHRLEYWFRTLEVMINLRTVPIIVVGTHLDKIKSMKKTKIQEAKAAIQRIKGSVRIAEFFFINNNKISSIREVRNHLCKVASEMLAMMSVPPLYLKLADIADNEYIDNYLTWNEYAAMAYQDPNSETLTTATKFLHDVGSLIWFPKTNLQNIVIMKPQWLANVMRSVVSVKSNFKGGVLNSEILPHLWKEFPEDIHKKLIYLLTKFEIAYPLTGAEKDKKFLVPCLFPNEPSPEFIAKARKFYDKDCLVFGANGILTKRYERMFKFRFLPLGFFSRLVVRVMQDILELQLEADYWQNGIILKNKKGQTGLLEYFKINSKTHLRQINIVVLSNTEGAASDDLFPELIQAIESMLTVEISTRYSKRLKLQRDAICSHCFPRYFSPKADHYASVFEDIEYEEDFYGCENFPYSLLVQSVRSGKTKIHCKGIPVFLDDLCPDVCLAQIPTLNASFGQLNKLGEGAFGMVYQTTMKRVGETSEIPVAIKELQNDLSLNLKNSESNVSEFKAFAHEVNIMSKLDHINLVKLFGIVIQPNSLWMVLELCSVGSLWDFLYGKHKNPIQEKLKFKISHNIAKGVDYLHSNCFPPIVHRDLRSPNIFMVSDNPEDNVVCKVGDFGLAQQAAPHLSEVLDTWQWMAPETFRSENIRYDHSSDIYSMSIMFSEIFAERRPFEDKLDYMISRPVVRPLEEVLEEYEDTDAFLKNGEWKINFDKSTAEGIVLEFDTLRIKIAIEENDLRPTLPTSLHPTLTKLIHTAWHKDPEQRPSSSQIVSELNSILKLHSINIEEVPIVKTSTTPNYQPKNTRIISHLEDWDYSALNERFSCLCMEENPNPKYYTFWAGSFSGKIYKFERSKDVPWTKINNSWQQVTTISVFPVIKEKVTLTHLFMHKSAPNYIWSISEAGGLFVLDTLTSKVIHQHKSMIKCYAISQDNFIFTGNLEGEIQIWAVDSLALVGTHQLLKTNQISPVYSISVLSDGHLFVGSKKIIYIFSFQIQTDGAVVLTPIQNWKAHDGPIKQLLFPNQPNLLWSCSQSQIIVWNFKIEKGKFLIEKLITDCKGHEKDVTNIIKVASLKIIPHIWTSAEDRCILVWHETGLVKLELRGPLGNSDNISMVEPGIVVSGSTDLNDHHFHFWGYSSDN